jgi:hypothetical protein
MLSAAEKDKLIRMKKGPYFIRNNNLGGRAVYEGNII